MKTVRALLDYGIEAFEQAGLSYGHGTTNALDEAAWLILHALGLPLDQLNAHLDRPLPDAQWKAARALLDERVRTRKPAAYLTHEAWLGPHRFYVDERVIVPRSFIAEWLWKPRKPGTVPDFGWRDRGLSPVSVLDLCTGSGCLAILAALAYPRAKVDAADLSEDALAVAARNVRDYGLEGRVTLLKSDLFSALGGRKYDLILSNPPYVKAASMRKLPDEYRKEPAMALASGVDGLDHVRAILAAAPAHLAPGGLLVVEIGHNRKALERAYPGLPFEWPKASAGAGYVFVLPRSALEKGGRAGG
ncbi:MAG TPA: 50S ribosomal protein L3 N(5)-glutamine methyltransferase [Usitatibacter sp.]|nr:50S ribosomal protein L3 N(5)-glutamine methyltransferase [Usitatibacter sp.]